MPQLISSPYVTVLYYTTLSHAPFTPQMRLEFYGDNILLQQNIFIYGTIL